MINLFHRHDWKKIARTYAEPSGKINSLNGNSPEIIKLVEKIDFGVTTILWECQDSKCRKLSGSIKRR